MTTLILTFVLSALVPGTPGPSPDENAGWAALNAAIQHHSYPPRGRMVRQPRPDYVDQLRKVDAALTTAKGTSAEPIALFYKGNSLFFLGRFAEAKAVLADLQKRFPNHGLCALSASEEGEDDRSPVATAIDDCTSEMEIRKGYTVHDLPEAVLDETQKAILHTTKGDIEIQFYTSSAPKAVSNFRKLIESGFYNETYFHRVLPFRVIEAGCPNTKAPNRPRTDDGFGSPGYTLPVELSTALHTAGSVSMCQSPTPGEAHGSQFTICISDQPDLNNKQAVFGVVVDGIEVVKRISQERADDLNNPYERIWIRGSEWIVIP